MYVKGGKFRCKIIVCRKISKSRLISRSTFRPPLIHFSKRPGKMSSSATLSGESRAQAGLLLEIEGTLDWLADRVDKIDKAVGRGEREAVDGLLKPVFPVVDRLFEELARSIGACCESGDLEATSEWDRVLHRLEPLLQELMRKYYDSKVTNHLA